LRCLPLGLYISRFTSIEKKVWIQPEARSATDQCYSRIDRVLAETALIILDRSKFQVLSRPGMFFSASRPVHAQSLSKAAHGVGLASRQH